LRGVIIKLDEEKGKVKYRKDGDRKDLNEPPK